MMSCWNGNVTSFKVYVMLFRHFLNLRLTIPTGGGDGCKGSGREDSEGEEKLS